MICKNKADNYTTKLFNIYTCTNYIYRYQIKEDETSAVRSSGVLISPYPDLLLNVFCLMLRIFNLMLVFLYI
jgi:hypothetical protein